MLYVGKAKNLRARLSNYFAPLRTLHERTAGWCSRPGASSGRRSARRSRHSSFEYTWIKEFDPPFNVKFRDDKSYPYMAITMGEESPGSW